MLTRWLRRAAGRVGLHLPFPGVICAEGIKTIRIEPDERTRVTVTRTLVFTETPADGDLRDIYPLARGGYFGEFVYDSPDAIELARERNDATSVAIHWRPREPITRYALYQHQHGWMDANTPHRSASCAEYRCDMRTGVFTIDLITPTRFETAIAFQPPRWRSMTTERQVVGYALKCLRNNGEQPRIVDNGTRATWEIRGPRMGARYMFVAFHEHGVADWEAQLNAASLIGRARRAVAGWVPALSR